jgi:hypothetical protein
MEAAPDFHIDKLERDSDAKPASTFADRAGRMIRQSVSGWRKDHAPFLMN